MIKLPPILPPPSPTNIDKFPSEPAPQKLTSTTLPVTLSFTYGVLVDLSIVMNARWVKLLEGTSQPIAPFCLSVSYTKGTETSTTDTHKFSASLGVADNILSVGASLSETFSKTISFTESETIETKFYIQNDTTPVSAVWWQLQLEFLLSGGIAADWPYSKKKTGAVNACIRVKHEEYASSEWLHSN